MAVLFVSVVLYIQDKSVSVSDVLQEWVSVSCVIVTLYIQDKNWSV